MMSSQLFTQLLSAAALLAPGEISTTRNDYNYTSASAADVAVFARSDAEFARAKILIVRGSASPELIEFSDERYSDSDPQISPDGRTLWFVSDRPIEGEQPHGGLNVWRSDLLEGRWAAPRPISKANSAGVELGPEVHGDQLTFNSTRRGGAGGLDIWSMPLAGDEPPQPFSAPINSKANEGDFTLSKDGRVALFWSDRPGGAGGGDIWLSVKQDDTWSNPVNLGRAVNGPGFEFTPSLSPDERTLYFASAPAGGASGLADIYSIRVSDVPLLARALRDVAAPAEN
jgi:Tol biopolymer transport system component